MLKYCINKTTVIFSLAMMTLISSCNSQSPVSNSLVQKEKNSLEICAESNLLGKVDADTDYKLHTKNMNMQWNACLDGLISKDQLSAALVFNSNVWITNIFSKSGANSIKTLYTAPYNGSSWQETLEFIGNSTDGLQKDIDARNIRKFVPPFGVQTTISEFDNTRYPLYMNGAEFKLSKTYMTNRLDGPLGTNVARDGLIYLVINWDFKNSTSKVLGSSLIPKSSVLWEELPSSNYGDLPNEYSQRLATQTLTKNGGNSRTSLPPGGVHQGAWVFEIPKEMPKARKWDKNRDFVLILETEGFLYSMRILFQNS